MIQRAVEKWMRPSVNLAGRELSTFQICGVAGFVLAIATAALLGMPAFLLCSLAVAGAGSFLGLALLALAALGRERLVFYHHELAVLAVSAGVAAALDYPVLPELDIVVVALSVFLACGRAGCWMVGCCHGRPHRHGLRYRQQHAEVGFASCLVGVRLVPVQLIEALAVLALAIAAGARLLAGDLPPGRVLADQLIAYASLRFALEFLRGDAERPMLGELSEAQWTSVFLALAVAGAEALGWLPRSGYHLPCAVGLLLLAGVVSGHRRRAGSRYPLLSPSHVREVAQVVQSASADAAPVQARTTSRGVRLSASTIVDGTRKSHLYTLSAVDRRAAHTLSSLILTLQPRAGRSELVEARPGLFHLIVSPLDEH